MSDVPAGANGPTTDVINFGCRLNAYESAAMRELAAASGITDAVIVNTCAVTAEAERQARQAIRKARRARPGARIIVTGCAAQINPAAFAAMPEVDRVVGNARKLEPASFAPATDAASDARVLVSDIMAVRETAGHLVHGFEGRARAFVQVQQGCDHRCTFCVIPYGRGNSRSVPAGAVVEQVRTLVENGYGEIVLTGVDVTAYGADLPGQPTLGTLVRRVLRLVPALRRLRLSSLDPVEIDDALWRALAEEPRLMPHLHLSLQAGGDLVLKRMKRRHTRADAIAACDRARALRPDTAFGADLIAGFPTETDDDFAATRALVDECGLAYLHVFPFSARPGTPAARMPQVPGAVVTARAAALRAAGAAALARFLDAQLGRAVSVLAEQADLGRAENFAPVRLQDATPGRIAAMRITGRHADALQAERAA
ncbi:MAG TPA: tRNA (N(6)-L-threonylcarbamoyladenosine(37)-C(2))-methylthiotransferase MtaB [Candidatus Sulfotelmatobacter sp.]|nr:tRNA (N(6)-L-threonylcarbamoyladenosine(37)-C(2))-methylthiotransferase MtaB [Candidatus Sulfotelmatobacter sp.]